MINKLVIKDGKLYDAEYGIDSCGHYRLCSVQQVRKVLSGEEHVWACECPNCSGSVKTWRMSAPTELVKGRLHIGCRLFSVADIKKLVSQIEGGKDGLLRKRSRTQKQSRANRKPVRRKKNPKAGRVRRHSAR